MVQKVQHEQRSRLRAFSAAEETNREAGSGTTKITSKVTGGLLTKMNKFLFLLLKCGFVKQINWQPWGDKRLLFFENAELKKTQMVNSKIVIFNQLIVPLFSL